MINLTFAVTLTKIFTELSLKSDFADVESIFMLEKKWWKTIRQKIKQKNNCGGGGFTEKRTIKIAITSSIPTVKNKYGCKAAKTKEIALTNILSFF